MKQLNAAPERLFFRSLIVSFLLVFCLHCLGISNKYYSRKNLVIEANGDRFITYDRQWDQRSAAIKMLLEIIDRHLPPKANFAVIPEGTMLNFLTRRPSPTRYIIFMMTEILSFGNENMLRNLRGHPPDYVVLFHKNTTEFGYPSFGCSEACGKTVLDWIKANYVPYAQIGAEPFVGNVFGVKIMKRKTETTNAPKRRDRGQD